MLKILGVLALLTTTSFAQNQQARAVNTKMQEASTSHLAFTVRQLVSGLQRFESRLDNLREDLNRVERKVDDILVQQNPPAMEKSISGKRLTPGNETIVFSVYRTTVFGPFSTDINVVWEHIITHEGFGWDHVAGQFIAPTRGMYIFHLTVSSSNGGRSFARINKNGQQVIRAHSSSENNYVDGTAHIALILEVFDQVNVQLLANSVIYSDVNIHAHFSGYLLATM